MLRKILTTKITQKNMNNFQKYSKYTKMVY